MTKYYKIKVGIEEYPVEEKDIPRIVEAMKTNDMVRLDSGIFRGHAILAMCRDIEREKEESLIELSKVPVPETPEQEKDRLLKEARKICKKCDNHSGRVTIQKNGEWVVAYCDCQKSVLQILNMSDSPSYPQVGA